MKIENIKIRKGNGYGQYVVTGEVNGVEVKAHTTDSEAYDYLYNDENLEKSEEALLHCEIKLELAYQNL
jgi:hypothetical protein